MKITQFILTAHLLGLGALGTANATAVTVGPGTTPEANITTALTVKEGPGAPVVTWNPNPSIGGTIPNGTTLGTATIITPGAPDNCRLLIKKGESGDNPGVFMFHRQGGGILPTDFLQATVQQKDGSNIAIDTKYDSETYIQGGHCAGSIKIVAQYVKEQTQTGGMYTASIQLIGYQP
ncbi:hypothetical protein GRJ90_003656 [Salmonella enterica]|nr:hypothetical protein [Salmonella enterica]